jgi:hypothetical protein
MRESNYWLRVIKAVDNQIQSDKEPNDLIKESEELKRIPGSIVRKTNKN